VAWPKGAIALGRKGVAACSMARLDAAARRESITRETSLHKTLKWLMRAQDATPDDGVSYGYSLYEGWAPSYPETTGYILQSFLWYYDLFADDDILARARRMAHWEVDIQMPEGATPGGSGPDRPIPVAFNTGQVLLGWAEYLRRQNDPRIRAAATRAGRWLVASMEGSPYFVGAVSSEAEHGDLSYNTMVSWGLAELADVLGDDVLAQAAHRSASHYAELIDDANWPVRSGFSDADSAFPLTHTLGYTVQGLLEVGRLSGDRALVDAAKGILDAARRIIDPATGFLPGRVRPGWSRGARWGCPTGSAQFAYSYLRLVLTGRGEPGYLDLAARLVDWVIQTQVSEGSGRPEIAYGVRGSYPFDFRGYQAVTLPNWAAKFLVDALMLLHRLGRVETPLGNPPLVRGVGNVGGENRKVDEPVRPGS
jgi:hypothetical protein